jgi:exodeoxyribonuclease VII small subunit
MTREVRPGGPGGVAKETAKKELGYEEVIGCLEEVVKRLEAGNLPLEESLKAFEEGIALVRSGEARLNEAEKRVEQLLATPQGDKVVPLDPGAGTGEPPPPDDADIPF